MSKVAVIGCGAFGALSALRLKEAGFDVAIYERLPRALGGASLNNQNRLHLGFHYPRSDATCRQCILGFEHFVEEFGECVYRDFPMIYFIAGEGSMTNVDDYLAFCDRHQLHYERVAPADYSVEVANIDLAISCDEAVYDSAQLSALLTRRLSENGIDVHFSTEVTALSNQGDDIEITFADGSSDTVNAVVNATYANVNHFSEMLGHTAPERQFEYTVVPIVRPPFPRSGITVMDGPFLTLLPYGSSDDHLLYHVDHSVVAREYRRSMNLDWLDPATAPFAAMDKESYFQRMVDSAAHFLPQAREFQLTGFLEGPRMVLPRVDDSDARPSIIEAVQPNYITVFSGKIDHCIWAADEVVAHLSSLG